MIDHLPDSETVVSPITCPRVFNSSILIPGEDLPSKTGEEFLVILSEFDSPESSLDIKSTSEGALAVDSILTKTGSERSL